MCHWLRDITLSSNEMFIYHHTKVSVYLYIYDQQESIPVGCKLPTYHTYFIMHKFEHVWRWRSPSLHMSEGHEPGKGYLYSEVPCLRGPRLMVGLEPGSGLGRGPYTMRSHVLGQGWDGGGVPVW